MRLDPVVAFSFRTTERAQAKDGFRGSADGWIRIGGDGFKRSGGGRLE